MQGQMCPHAIAAIITKRRRPGNGQLTVFSTGLIFCLHLTKREGRPAPRHGLPRPTSTRRPVSVTRTRATSIDRPPATTRSVPAVASPCRIRSASMLAANPCATIIASVQPSGDTASNSSALRRVAGGLRLRLCVSMGRERRTKAWTSGAQRQLLFQQARDIDAAR
jgi:hypothetical protein